MKIIEIKVKNFRTIENEQIISFKEQLTIVGPNNTGKTNLLTAIQMLFTGYQNLYGYSSAHDLTFGIKNATTSISGIFIGDPKKKDKGIYNKLGELHKLQGTKRTSDQIPLNLYFVSGTDNPVYNIFSNIKRPREDNKNAQYSRIHKQLVTSILEQFSIHYIPSSKSIDQVYDHLLMPFLRRIVAKKILSQKNKIEDTLNKASQSLNYELAKSGLSEIKANFSIPGDSLENMITKFDFLLSDPSKTQISKKGMGIQSTSILSGLKWVTLEEKSDGKSVIWLLEEPESYLHPELSHNCNLILNSLADESLVIKTTHSMSFVPQDPLMIRGIKLNSNLKTEVIEYKTFSDAVTSIRSSLGVKFSDFYNLSKYNLMVEGPSDREIYVWVLNNLPQAQYKWENLRQAKFEDFGGVKFLSGFLRATYEFIIKERACIAIFDGDSAGQKERQDLQQYFGRKNIPFQPNLNFISTGGNQAIEGLFPSDWIKDIFQSNSNWFENYSVDTSDNLENFKIHDKNKKSVQNILLKKAEIETNFSWAERFIKMFDILDDSLDKLDKNIKT